MLRKNHATITAEEKVAAKHGSRKNTTAVNSYPTSNLVCGSDENGAVLI